MTSTIPWQQRLSTVTAATQDEVIGWSQCTRQGKSYAPDMIWSTLQTGSAQNAATPGPAALPLETIGHLRTALRSGHGFPGDRESYEADLQRALEAS
ncbi:hypothetical protein [Streptomyces sp. NPDC005799]|uniref:hypothetical protein n=1 Tax=Streptomyces sp. NPDC005799 TaxID=3154678 RepID=UPI0033D73DEF